MSGRRHGTLCLGAGALLACVPIAAAARSEAPRKLPPQTLRGPAIRLHQYPTVSLATPAQRAAAKRLLAEIRTAARDWQDPRGATAAGFGVNRRPRAENGSVGYLHAEHRGYRNDKLYLDPKRPETIVYANVARRPLVLIGVMFSMPRGVHGATPGGPITRWHTHRVCVRGQQRGLTPRPDGTCPRGAAARQGSEMMHVWFTRDLRSSYAIHAPRPDLCVARLLPARVCRRPKHTHG